MWAEASFDSRECCGSPDRRGWPGAVDQKICALLSGGLRCIGLVHEPSTEVFWPIACVEQVFKKLAACDRAILGFDIIFIDAASTPRIVGTSAYHLKTASAGTHWAKRVDISLRLALGDLARLDSLCVPGPRLESVYFSVVAADRREYTRLALFPRTM
ncbi:MAG TPA: hypothetical protein VHX17_12355 [Candidatus Cybelea sp.]|nr:hypothetical protein [Candidatus Cybelea sp.]